MYIHDLAAVGNIVHMKMIIDYIVIYQTLNEHTMNNGPPKYIKYTILLSLGEIECITQLHLLEFIISSYINKDIQNNSVQI